MTNNIFVADVHLGRLAKWLRMLGFDTLYKNDYSRTDLLHIAYEQQRVVLSRDKSFLKNPFVVSFIPEAANPEIQLRQIVQHFRLQEKVRAFSLCLICNAPLHAVSKTSVQDRLPEATKMDQTERPTRLLSTSRSSQKFLTRQCRTMTREMH